MAGKVVQLIPKRTFDFGSIRLGATLSLILAEQIDISQFCEGILLTRVHGASMAGGSLSLQLVPDGYTPRDVLTFQAESSSYFNLTTVVDASSSAGELIALGGNDGEFGGEYVMLQLNATRLAPSPAPIIASISVDLLLRTPDDVDGAVYRAVEKAGGCCCAE